MTVQILHEKICELVRAQIADVKGLDELPIGDEDLLFDFDSETPEGSVLDSLDALELSLMLEDRFKVELPADIDVSAFQTISAIAQFIEEQISTDQEWTTIQK